MRMLLIAVITLAASLPTGACAQGAPQRSDVPAPPLEELKIDPSSVKFLLAPGAFAGEGNGCNSVQVWGGPKEVYGIVATEVNFDDDQTARQLVQMGIAFGQEKCPSVEHLKVSIVHGDPASFLDPRKCSLFGYYRGNNVTVDWAPDLLTGEWLKDRPGVIVNYLNFQIGIRKSEMERAQEKKREAAERERQAQAERGRQSMIVARASAFFKSTGVTRMVTAEQLDANPFVFKGQVVGVHAFFGSMISENQAIFYYGNAQFVVSGVPSSKFTQRGSAFMLAAKVLGNISIPALGPTMVPHLSYLGAAPCQDLGCSEYVSNFR